MAASPPASQISTPKTTFRNQIVWHNWTEDPGTRQYIPLALAWRTMWLESATIRWEVASTSQSATSISQSSVSTSVSRAASTTAKLAVVADGVAKSTNTALTSTLSVLQTAATAYSFVISPTQNRITENELFLLAFDAAASGEMGEVTITAQFTTRQR